MTCRWWWAPPCHCCSSSSSWDSTPCGSAGGSASVQRPDPLQGGPSPRQLEPTTGALTRARRWRRQRSTAAWSRRQWQHGLIARETHGIWDRSRTETGPRTAPQSCRGATCKNGKLRVVPSFSHTT